MDIFNWCLVLEGDTIKNKPNVIVQRCLCVGEKCQSSPPPLLLVFLWAHLQEHETLGAIAVPLGSW